jgi:hypothetical protein
VRVGTVPTLYYTKGALPSKHEGATLRKIGAKQYYVIQNTKIVKNPLQRERVELKWTSLLQH